MTVAVWTMISRVTGLARVIVIGAVLGPTFFGNSYQLTNVLPNLVFYGFLAGSLLSSLLVPALVRHIDVGDGEETGRVAGGFLGVEWSILLVAAPVAVLAVPLFLPNGEATLALAVLAIPQVFCYAMVASATAVMYAKRRYLLAAAAPALENLGVIAVLVLAGSIYADPANGSRADGSGAADRRRIHDRRGGARRRPVVGCPPVRRHPRAASRLARRGRPAGRTPRGPAPWPRPACWPPRRCCCWPWPGRWPAAPWRCRCP